MKLIGVASLALILVACSGRAADESADAARTQIHDVAAQLATTETFLRQANDAAVWVNPADHAGSLLFVSGGEGGLEIHDLSGARVARFEALEAEFIEVRQSVPVAGQTLDLVITSDLRLGGVHVHAFEHANRSLRELTASPIEVGDEITGLCSYQSKLTGKLYFFAATDQGQLEQWQLYFDGGKASGRLVRRIPAGKGAGHCVADDAGGTVYFTEESVGIWRVAAEPESDHVREPFDLVAPRGSIEEEVKGIALYRNARQDPLLVAANAGAGTLQVYTLDGEPLGAIRVAGGGRDLDEAEGLTAVAGELGPAFPQGALIVADEGTGNYKLVGWKELAQTLNLAARSGSSEAPPQKAGAPRLVEPKVETEPEASFGDAADDPAIWVDTRNPARSVVIATDKKLGLNVYDLQGKRLQVVPDGRMNNVDLRNGFVLGGRPITVVAATNRTTRSISLYRFDPVTRRLSSISDGVLETGFDDPYGLCMYHSAKSGLFYVFANNSGDGKVRQWKLVDRGGKAGIELVREIAVGSQAEGCAADDELGTLYIAEEDVGLWKYSAEPDGGTERTSIDTVKDGNLVDDVEGVAIYYGENGTGFVIVSNQGEDNYAVYRREGNNAFVGKFHIVANERLGIDGTSETDGLDVVSHPLGPDFPAGMLVVQDGRNLMPAARQNFKYISWQDVMEALR
jgi:3-phytase